MARKLLAGGFSKDGAQVYGIVRNTTGEGAEWQLYAIDVKTGAEKMLAPLDLPASTDGVAGFCILTATPSSRPSPSGRCDRCAFAFGRVLQYISWSRSHREGGGSLPLRNETHRAKTCKRNSTSGTTPFLRTGGGWPTHRMSRERINRDHPPWRIKNWRSVIFF